MDIGHLKSFFHRVVYGDLGNVVWMIQNSLFDFVD